MIEKLLRYTKIRILPLLCFSLIFNLGLTQQISSVETYLEVQELDRIYTLSKKQELKLKTIIQDRNRSFQQIEYLRESDPNEYRKKQVEVKQSFSKNFYRLLKRKQKRKYKRFKKKINQ